jgi:hypothetical protein
MQNSESGFEPNLGLPEDREADEIELEKIREDVNQMFDELDFEIIDPGLKAQVEAQEVIVTELLSREDAFDENMIIIPAYQVETMKLCDLFELAIRDDNPDQSAYMMLQVKKSIRQMKQHYTAGNINTARKALYFEDNSIYDVADQQRGYSEAQSKLADDIKKLAFLIDDELEIIVAKEEAGE